MVIKKAGSAGTSGIRSPGEGAPIDRFLVERAVEPPPDPLDHFVPVAHRQSGAPIRDMAGFDPQIGPLYLRRVQVDHTCISQKEGHFTPPYVRPALGSRCIRKAAAPG